MNQCGFVKLSVVFFVLRKKEGKTEKRMKEEEIENGDYGLPTRKVSLRFLRFSSCLSSESSWVLLWLWEKRMKEEEIENGDYGPPTLKVSLRFLRFSSCLTYDSSWVLLWLGERGCCDTRTLSIGSQKIIVLFMCDSSGNTPETHRKEFTGNH